MATNLDNYEKYALKTDTEIKGILTIYPDQHGYAGIYIPKVLRMNNMPLINGGTEGNLCLEQKNADINRSRRSPIQGYAFCIGYDEVSSLEYEDHSEEPHIATYTMEEDNKTITIKFYDIELQEEYTDSITSAGDYVRILDDCSSPRMNFNNCFIMGHLASTIESIGERAFLNCSYLTITDQLFPEALQTIGARAFENCSSLGTIHAENCTNLTTIGEDAFKGAVGTIYLGEVVFDNFLSQRRILKVGDIYKLDDMVAIRVSQNGGN